MKSILVALFLVVSYPFLFGQDQSPKVKRGNYSHFTLPKPTQDTLETEQPVIRVSALCGHVIPFSGIEIKHCRSIKYLPSNLITCLGLNTDNPTYYGKYKQVGDTLFVHINYSIQHFNKLNEKRRVKTKLEILHKYVILPNGDLAQDNCYWRRDED